MANNEIQGIQIFSNKQMFIIKVSWIHFYLRYSHVSQGGNNYINKHSSKIDLSNTIEDISMIYSKFNKHLNDNCMKIHFSKYLDISIRNFL